MLNTKQHSYEGSISWFSQSVRVGFLFSIYQLLLFNLIALGVSDKEIDPTDLKERATRILNNNCVSCHGPEKQKGDVQLNDLESIDAVDLQSLFINMKEVVHVKENRELPYCGIYRYEVATGKTFLISKEMELPNGITLSPDEKWIYVGSSDMKDPKMWRFSSEDGTGKVFYDGPYADDDAGWFDGIKTHKSGNIFATGPGGILVISPEGKKLATIRLPDPVTNCCFDENQEFMYVTSFAYVARFKLKK